MHEPLPILMENSIRIAWDYLERTGDLGDPEVASRFLLETVEQMVRKGERRRLLLSNYAIDAYRKFATERRCLGHGVIEMGDNLTKKETPDRSKINMHQPHEVHYWTNHLNISKEDLQRAIDRVGNGAAAVRKELAAK